MLYFGKKSFSASPRAAAARLRDLVCATPRPEPGQAREWLAFTGQIEQAVIDGGGWPGVAEITRHAAALFLDRTGMGDGAAARARLIASLTHAAGRLSQGDLTFRIPEGYAWYAVYPDAYARTAERWASANPGRAVTVIGLLSIGTSLSAVVAEQLRRCGARVTSRRLLRPGGHPFRRRVDLAEALAWGEAFIIVDEGPGLSGSSMAGVAAALHEKGAAKDAIFFFPGHGGGPGAAAGEGERRWWSKGRCWHSPADDLHPPPGTTPGASHMFGGFAAVDGQLRTLAVLRQERQMRLADRGFALPFRSACNGWITMEAGGPPLRLRNGDADFLRSRLAPYIAEAAMPAGHDDTIPVALERIASALIAHARAHRPDLPSATIHRMKEDAARDGIPSLLHGDGQLQPGEWVRLSGPRVLKRNASGTDWEHSWPGQQSVLWDVAGAAVEWRLAGGALRLLLEELSVRGRIEALPRPLAFHRAGYCCFRLARARQHGDETAARGYNAGLEAALAELGAMP